MLANRGETDHRKIKSRWIDAARMYETAAPFLMTVDRDHWRFISLWNDAACLYAEAGNYEVAKVISEKALELVEKHPAHFFMRNVVRLTLAKVYKVI